MPSRKSYRLYGARGGGSMIVEAAIVRAGLPVEYVDLQWDDIGWDSRTLAPLNPLGQVPTLELPSGAVMTESAAMILHFAERSPAAGLVPPIDHPAHVAFLRWLVFLVAAVYPTFTYGDDPKRWLDGDEDAAKNCARRMMSTARSCGVTSRVRSTVRGSSAIPGRRSICTYGR